MNPALLEGYGRVELLDIPGRWGRTDSYGLERRGAARGRRPRLR